MPTASAPSAARLLAREAHGSARGARHENPIDLGTGRRRPRTRDVAVAVVRGLAGDAEGVADLSPRALAGEHRTHVHALERVELRP